MDSAATTPQKELGEVLVFHSPLATNSIGYLNPLPLSLCCHLYTCAVLRVSGDNSMMHPNGTRLYLTKRQRVFPSTTEQKNLFFRLQEHERCSCLSHHHPSVRSGRLVL